jgi:beta-N-acetylhexosaminidase
MMSDINRLALITLPGPSLSSETVRHLERYRPGGVVLFKQNLVTLEQSRALIADLKSVLGDDLLLAVDQEGGNVWRTSFLPSAPSAGNLGASNDPDLTRVVGAEIAHGMRSIGANWCFGPVLDINVNPLNPVIGDRSFGADPEIVAQLGKAWLEGLQSGGVAACAKHFPGHGDTYQDSHHDLPTVDKPLTQLELLEFAPFKAVLEGVSSVMTAHIVFPAIDPDLPATLSPRILTGLLRQAWGYNGAIVTDAMDMGAITKRWGRGPAAVQSLSAGADILEVFGSLATQIETFEALERAAAQGVLTKTRIADANDRRDRLAHRYPALTLEQPSLNPDLMVGAWRRGITRSGHPRSPAPGSSVAVILSRDNPGGSAWERGLSGSDILKALERVYRVTPIWLEQSDMAAAVSRALEMKPTFDALIYVSSQAGRLTAATRAAVSRMQPDLHLALWNPYAVSDVDAPALLTYGLTAESLEALVRVLRSQA